MRAIATLRDGALLLPWMLDPLHIFNLGLPYRAKLCRAKIFFGRNFRNQTKNSSLVPDE